MLDQAVLQHLQGNRDRQLEKLFELLSIAGIASRNDGQCQRAAQWLADYLQQELGFQARIAETQGQPNVLGECIKSDDAPTVLIYGHYDVQPPDPLELWDTGPFEPAIRNGYIYARGANDDKGQLFAHLMAIKSWQQAGGGLPVNVKVFFEGEEEIGSPNLEPFVAAHAKDLSADAALVSDSAFFAKDVPSITYALRGLVYIELTLRGPSRDVHSGQYGGAVANPLNALARIISQMHDDSGRVTIPGFYDDVNDLTQQEFDSWQKLPFNENAFASELGLHALAGGEDGYSALERLWARPTLDCNGIIGGYTAPGPKTVIPSTALAKISMRLVPSQNPEHIVRQIEEFLSRHTPSGMQAELSVMTKARPVLLQTDSPAMSAAKAAYAEGFGQEPALIRCGASVPVTELIQRLLGIDAVLMGFGLPDDRLHSPNERFALDQLYGGAIASAAFMQNFAGRQ